MTYARDAYGIGMQALALKPQEFWRLTPREFNDMVDGWRWRKNRTNDDFAIWVAALINGMGKVKHPVQPSRLLGRPVGVDFDPAKDAALRAHRLAQQSTEAKRKTEVTRPKIILATR